MLIAPRIRAYICTTAHPTGCRHIVDEQIARALARPMDGPVTPLSVLVIGGSAGYGLASRITCAFAAGAKTLSLSFEKEPTPESTATKYDILLYTQGERVEYLRRLIFAGSAAQVLAIAGIGALFNWAAISTTLLDRTQANYIAQGYILLYSGVSTVMLLSAYITAATILGWRSGRIMPYFDPLTNKPIPFAQRQSQMNLLGIDPQIGLAPHAGLDSCQRRLRRFAL